MALGRPRVIEPGLLARVPGLERYRVEPGSVLQLRLLPDDELRVIDLEGSSSCVAQVSEGRLSGISGPTDLFGLGTWPGTRCSWKADSAITLTLSVDYKAMDVAESWPTAAISVEIQRSAIQLDDECAMPEPLALEMLLDMRIDRATAVSYEVAAGQWIQVIDVAGRQCSDLVAFNARELAAGRERGIDPTTTRTLLGALYPSPGLASKYFDQDMQPLLEVVRDTVGRHDTFGLACTAKYYEDMGYPGHPSCSENFNAALDRFGIEARRGWPAVNLWYNTRIIGTSIAVDEPESRPGDYVLMRALSDLVVGSSACPDDIDPTNAWNPTDVHVRVYDATRTFSRAIANRVTPDAIAQLTKQTGFEPRWSALTRRVTEYNGYWLPTSFSSEGSIAEYWACRERAAIMDLSPLRKFEITGPDAEALCQLALTRDVRKLAVGQVVYSAMCSETGGVLDDGTLFRLGPDLFRWICGSEFSGTWLRQLAAKHNLKVWVKHSTDQLHNVAVQGPASRDILSAVVWTPPTQPAVSEIGWFRFTIGRIGGPSGKAVLVSRTGYSGELGYEIFCHPTHSLAVWDALWEAGIPHGMSPLGMDALDILRIEAGLVFAGSEFDDTIDPYVAGIGFTVALAKGRSPDQPDHPGDDFIGKAALIRKRAAPDTVLVGLQLEGSEIGMRGDGVYSAKPQVGVVTSGCRSPILASNIALARVAPEFAALGTDVEVGKIDGHQKRIPATVVRFPFYDPTKSRPRS